MRASVAERSDDVRKWGAVGGGSRAAGCQGPRKGAKENRHQLSGPRHGLYRRPFLVCAGVQTTREGSLDMETRKSVGRGRHATYIYPDLKWRRGMFPFLTVCFVTRILLFPKPLCRNVPSEQSFTEHFLPIVSDFTLASSKAFTSCEAPSVTCRLYVRS